MFDFRGGMVYNLSIGGGAFDDGGAYRGRALLGPGRILDVQGGYAQ